MLILVHEFKFMCLCYSVVAINILLFRLTIIELAITFVIHLYAAIMKHGAYYETPTEILQFGFLTASYYTVTNFEPSRLC